MVSNEIYVSPGKFQGITINKKKQNHTAEYISIDQKNIKTSSLVKLLGLHIDNKLNFNLHITKICRSAANQLHALIKLRVLLNFEEKKTLINCYVNSNCNYCPIVWMFSNVKSLNNVESLQKRALRFLYENYVLSYEELLQKAGKETVEVNKLRCLCTEIYKSINNINPTYMNETVRSNYKLNLDVLTINQVSFGDKGLRYYGPKIWNCRSLFTFSNEVF